MHRPVDVLFKAMEGDSRQPGSEISTHMPTLYLLARQFCNVGPVVELGVGRGWSTLALLMGVEAASGTRYMFSYDPHPPIYEGVRKNFSEVGIAPDDEIWDRWVYHKQFGHLGAADHYDASLGLLFIDSLHGYENMLRELLTWEAKVHPKGMICGHDWELENVGALKMGVKPAVQKFLESRGDKWRLQVQPFSQGLFMLWPK